MGTVSKNDLVWTKKYPQKGLKNDKNHEKRPKLAQKVAFWRLPF